VFGESPSQLLGQWAVFDFGPLELRFKMINRWSHPVSYASPSQIAGTQFRVHQQSTFSKFGQILVYVG
jgi:hypothetical protein